MLTTKQVRKIMQAHGRGGVWDPIWTNKVKDLTVRHVKCYHIGGDALLNELKKTAGASNVWVTEAPDVGTQQMSGIVVRCTPA